MPEIDIHKILRDLEMKAVGVDPATQEMQEGYFVSFRNVGLPTRPEDYANPFSPIGVNLNKDVPATPATDPANAPKTGSNAAEPQQKLYVSHGSRTCRGHRFWLIAALLSAALGPLLAAA